MPPPLSTVDLCLLNSFPIQSNLRRSINLFKLLSQQFKMLGVEHELSNFVYMNTRGGIVLTMIERWRGETRPCFLPRGQWSPSQEQPWHHRDFNSQTCSSYSNIQYSVPKLGYKPSLISGITYTALDEDLTLASVTLNSRRMYWGMLYSAMGSTTKYWYRAERSAGQYWWHFS